MQAHTVDRVESWDSRPFSDGVRDLRDLADDDFSGAAVADGTWLFMLNGRVVGVYEGEIEDFEDASGTVYDAPHPSLPLLFSMQERGGETQAKYYTNDTPLSEVDGTLTDGNFTGYVELSENVLSGDYYVVYYGGRSMSAAFIGASEELVAGDDAFERANDEVGVYEVRKTPVNVTSLPGTPAKEDGDDADGTGDGASAGAAGVAGAAAGADSAPGDPAGGDSATSDDAATTESSSGSTGSPPTEPTQHAGRDTTADAAAEAESGPTSSRDSSPSDPARAKSASDASAAGSSADTDNARSRQASSRTGDADGDSGESPASAGGAEAAAEAASEEGVFDDEEQWQNARSVPTLDPKQSENSGDAESQSSGRSQSEQRGQRQSGQRQSTQQQSEQRQSTQRQPTNANAGRGRSGQSGGRGSTVEKLKKAVQQRNEKLEAAGERIDSLEGERDDLQARVEKLRDERDELQARVEELETARDAGGHDGSGDASAKTKLEPDAALTDTNLFVRYDSKGKATLDELDSETDADAVNQNLRIDHHTKFEAEDVVVDGESFESFLTSSNAHRFVSWAVRELPYEIRDAGHASGLADLYEALPRVDRAELGGTVEGEVDGETVAQSFDVVLRDRMGEALVVAELNDERDAVSGDEMDALVDAATDVRECVDDLSAAMYVTASFFEPRALETASDATDGGGFLSRSDRESYVKVARKEGYHLCLVEDRNDAFHLTVPEL
ncbi:DUF7527 domain-containing protein [Halobacterium zhouii]|uniref:DUF7527 domain-containing protein n=1 Tax=Halobacterium zhouii TaxID=2902624 RepID=UPI001E350379|nr:hypothetical protein [Halobacterium zhouii]